MSARVVHEGCALAWLRAHPLPADASVLTSLPSFDEFSQEFRRKIVFISACLSR